MGLADIVSHTNGACTGHNYFAKISATFLASSIPNVNTLATSKIAISMPDELIGHFIKDLPQVCSLLFKLINTNIIFFIIYRLNSYLMPLLPLLCFLYLPILLQFHLILAAPIHHNILYTLYRQSLMHGVSGRKE